MLNSSLPWGVPRDLFIGQTQRKIRNRYRYNARKNAEWSFVGFKVVKLKAQETHEFETNDREFCLVPITGTFDAQLSDSRFDAVGGRENLFDQELTEHLYVPEQEPKLSALDELELALCSAPGGSFYLLAG